MTTVSIGVCRTVQKPILTLSPSASPYKNKNKSNKINKQNKANQKLINNEIINLLKFLGSLEPWNSPLLRQSSRSLLGLTSVKFHILSALSSFFNLYSILFLFFFSIRWVFFPENFIRKLTIFSLLFALFLIFLCWNFLVEVTIATKVNLILWNWNDENLDIVFHF